MIMKTRCLIVALTLMCGALTVVRAADAPQPAFPPFPRKSEPPADCPFPPSREITGIEFLGVHSDYRFADTWYPSWAADGNWNGNKIKVNPPGTRYGLVLQPIRLLGPTP